MLQSQITCATHACISRPSVLTTICAAHQVSAQATSTIGLTGVPGDIAFQLIGPCSECSTGPSPIAISNLAPAHILADLARRILTHVRSGQSTEQTVKNTRARNTP